MAQQVVLYDLASKPPVHSWSGNVWKTRLLLNFKGIDYKTEFLEYPELGPTLNSFGIPPIDPNTPGYFVPHTVPTIRDANGSYVMDSWVIAQALEKQYPSPPLYLDNSAVVEFINLPILMPIFPICLPLIPKILSKVSAEFFTRTREGFYGKPLDQLTDEQGAEACWAEMSVEAKKIGDTIRKTEGPFLLGNAVSYADLILVAMMHALKQVDQGVHEKFMALDSAFLPVYEACGKWVERDD